MRGVLTRESLGLDSNTPLGDLGLIADTLIPIKRPLVKSYHVGIVPHFRDKGDSWVKHVSENFNGRVAIVDVERSAESVANEISKCDLIVSSSLHGIIVADAFDIPSVWCELSDKVVGGGFKFRDYGSSIDIDLQPIKPNELKDLSRVEKFIQYRSFGAVQRVKKSVSAVWTKYLKDQKHGFIG